MKFASRLAASILLLTCAWPAAAQERRPNELPDPLLVRARAVSDDLTADAPSLLLHDRALLWARLGEVWWKDDERRARALMLKAVEEVEKTSEQEESIERARRLAAARALLAVVGKRDRELGERLSAVLAATRKSVQATDGREREQNAEALANAALEVLDADPRRAAELGSASFRAGGSSQQSALLMRLHKKDAGLAVSLFREGLSAARASHDYALWGAINGAAFPHRFYFPPYPGPVFPEEIRAETLRALAENLLRAPASEEDDEKVCGFAWTAASLVEEFNALVPQQAGALRAAINRCQQKMHPEVRRHLDEEMGEPPKTVEDYLRVASDTRDERMRAFHLARAAYVAHSKGDPDRAIEIVEGMTQKQRETLSEGMDSEQRSALGDGWETARWNYAYAAALKHFKAGDRQTVRRVLDAVAPKLRAYALIYFLDQLAESKPRDFPAEMLGEARLLLSKYEGPEAPPYCWLTLVRLHAAYLPADGPRVFNEAVAGLNRWSRTRPKSAGEKGHEFPDYPWSGTNLHVALVEADEPGVTSAVASIDDRLMRSWARLGLLKALLEKRQAEPSQPSGPKSWKGARAKQTP